jgi:hypothetical protein
VNFSANSNSGAASSFTITAPASIVNGDMLIAALTVSGGGGAATITPPAGFTTCVTEFSPGTNPRGVAYYKVANNEAGNYIWTASGNTSFFSGSIAHFKNTQAVPDQCGTGQNGTGTTATALSVNSSTNFDYLIYFGGSDGNGTLGIPAGFTDCGNVTGSATAEGFACGYIGPVATGATGNKTATTITPWGAALISLK